MKDLLNPVERKAILDEIYGNENQSRKKDSFIQYEIYREFQHKYVFDYLSSQFSANTVKEMPIISSINLCRRIVKQEASVYKSAPDREFYNLSDEQEQIVEEIYEKAKVNRKLSKANEMLKLLGQCCVQMIPIAGELTTRVLMPHQYDVIPNEENPEIADAYIISAYNREDLMTQSSDNKFGNQTGMGSLLFNGLFQNNINEQIGDADDYRVKQRFVVWTKDLNFIMDGKGNILSENIENPLGMLPFIDVYQDKDFEYFIRKGQTVSDFSIQFNSALSDLANVVRMQGWGQAFLKGPANLIPDRVQIGPNYIIKLAIDPNNPVETEFGFANPQADIAGSIQYIEMILATFLSSRGVDPKTVSGKGDATRYTSGIERLLALVEKFEASKEDFDVFSCVEGDLFEIFCRIQEVFSGTEFLLPEYQTGKLPEDTYVVANFNKPEMIQTKEETLNLIQTKMEIGLMSRLEAIMQDRGVDEQEAIEIMGEIDGENNGLNPNGVGGVPTNQSLPVLQGRPYGE